MSGPSSPQTSAGRSYRGLKAEERRQLRRQQLLDAGLHVIGSKGYGGSTVKEVCREAGLSERYFYESFASKEDLLSGVYAMVTDRLKDQFMAIMARQPREPRQVAMDSILMFYRHMQDPAVARVQLFEMLGVSERMDQEFQSAMDELAEFIGLAQRAIFPEIPERHFASGVLGAALAGGMIQVANTWVLRGYPQPLEEVAEEMLDLLWLIGEKLAEG